MSDRVAGIEIVLHIRRGFCNFVEDTRFRDGKIIMPRADRNTLAKLQIINDNLGSLESEPIDFDLRQHASKITLQRILRGYNTTHHPPEPFEAAPQKMSFFDVFNEFLDKHFDGAPLSGHYRVLARLLRRFELYGQKTTRTKFTLILNDFDYAEIERFK